MALITVGEIHERLSEEFYPTVEGNRNVHCGQDMGYEPYEWRAHMIQFLLNRIHDGAVVADYLSGDGVIPFALLYLQKHMPDLGRIHKVYMIDNDSDGGFALIDKNAKSFGLEDKVVGIPLDCDDPCLHEEIQGVDTSTLIDGEVYVSQPRFVIDPDGFYDNFSRAREGYMIAVNRFFPRIRNAVASRFAKREEVEVICSSGRDIIQMIGFSR